MTIEAALLVRDPRAEKYLTPVVSLQQGDPLDIVMVVHNPDIFSRSLYVEMWLNYYTSSSYNFTPRRVWQTWFSQTVSLSSGETATLGPFSHVATGFGLNWSANVYIYDYFAGEMGEWTLRQENIPLVRLPDTKPFFTIRKRVTKTPVSFADIDKLIAEVDIVNRRRTTNRAVSIFLSSPRFKRITGWLTVDTIDAEYFVVENPGIGPMLAIETVLFETYRGRDTVERRNFLFEAKELQSLKDSIVSVTDPSILETSFDVLVVTGDLIVERRQTQYEGYDEPVNKLLSWIDDMVLFEGAFRFS